MFFFVVFLSFLFFYLVFCQSASKQAIKKVQILFIVREKDKRTKGQKQREAHSFALSFFCFAWFPLRLFASKRNKFKRKGFLNDFLFKKSRLFKKKSLSVQKERGF